MQHAYICHLCACLLYRLLQATLERAIHDPDYFRELVSRRKPMEADVDLAAREEQLKAEYAIIAGSGERACPVPAVRQTRESLI